MQSFQSFSPASTNYFPVSSAPIFYGHEAANQNPCMFRVKYEASPVDFGCQLQPTHLVTPLAVPYPGQNVIPFTSHFDEKSLYYIQQQYIPVNHGNLQGEILQQEYMATNLYFPPSGASAPQQMALPADTDEVVFVQEHLVTGQGFQIVNHSPPVVPVNQMITPQNFPYMSNSYANLKQGNQSCNNSSRNFSQLELGSEKSLLGLESGMENFPLNFSPDLIPRQGKGPSGNAIGSIMHSKCQPDFPGSANTELDLEAVIDSKTINGNFPVLQSDLIPYYWLLLGNKFGLTLKDLYPVPLRFLNLFMNPESQLYTHIDTAKVRFSCRRCRNGWTSMFGSIIFWFQKYDNHCRVFYHALGQKCAKCLKSDWTLENILKIEEPSWYPSETERVINNLFMVINHKLYSGPLPNLMLKSRKSGRPVAPHVKETCSACMIGICRMRPVPIAM